MVNILRKAYSIASYVTLNAIGAKPGAPPILEKKGAGHVWEGKPWLVAPNITPTKRLARANWTDDMLARSIREGISHDGRVLDSQMYYASYRHLSDEDLASVIVLPTFAESRSTTLYSDEIAGSHSAADATNGRGPGARPCRRRPGEGGTLQKIGTCIGCHTAFFRRLAQDTSAAATG